MSIALTVTKGHTKNTISSIKNAILELCNDTDGSVSCFYKGDSEYSVIITGADLTDMTGNLFKLSLRSFIKNIQIDIAEFEGETLEDMSLMTFYTESGF